MANASKQFILVYRNGNNKVNHLQGTWILDVSIQMTYIYIRTQNEF